MNDFKKELAQVTTEGKLIILLDKYARNYADDPSKQLRCFSLMVDNVYATPKFFEALVKHLDKVLTVDKSLVSSVLSVLHSMLQTRRVSIENCDFIADVLNSHKSKLPSFSSASVNIFVKGLNSYKKALKYMEQAFEQQEPVFVKPNDDLAKPKPNIVPKYAVNRPNPNIVPRYAVNRPNPNVVPKYAVNRPDLSKDGR
jgi:hypothetical protein